MYVLSALDDKRRDEEDDKRRGLHSCEDHERAGINIEVDVSYRSVGGRAYEMEELKQHKTDRTLGATWNM